MITPASRQTRRSRWIIALLLATLCARAEPEIPEENPHALLETALAWKLPPGAYRKDTVRTQKFMGMVGTDTCREYLVVKPDWTRLSRTETSLELGRSTYYNIYLKNEEGRWSLRDGRVAIHFSAPELEKHAGESEQTHKNRIASLSLTLRSETEGDSRYVVIAADLSEADNAEGRAFAAKLLGGIGNSVPAGPRKTIRKRVMENIPERLEYWLKEPARHLSSLRMFTKKGKLVGEIPFDHDSYEPIPEPPSEFFAIPDDYRRLYSKGLWDYADLLRAHPSFKSPEAFAIPPRPPELMPAESNLP